MENINWYPGHMKKTKDLIRSNLKMVDAVIEVIDSRIPVSSRNPIIDELAAGKPRVLVLNKSDLAEEEETRRWVRKFRQSGIYAAPMNSMTGAGTKQLFSLFDQMRKEIGEKKRRGVPLRMMIVGIPNSGKSSLINRLTGRKSAKTGDRPGVTRGKQWLTLKNGMQLLDTPGILWPKFDDPNTGLALAYCGSIREEILDITELAVSFIGYMMKEHPEMLCSRYHLDAVGSTAEETLGMIGAKRGFLLAGGRIDLERAARTVMDEFRSAKIGRLTLEKCPE
ncbi:MAG: ribosome biogenesis GTPase YlqF [Anaerovoracaceae bacterium]